MRQNNTAILLILLFYFVSAQAQINVQKADPKNLTSESEGLFYSLPQTVIQVDVEVNKIQHIKGPYAEYATHLLGLNQVINASTTDYEISKIKVSNFSRPDPLQYYFIELPRTKKAKDKLSLIMSSDGMLAGGGYADGPPFNNRHETSRNTNANLATPEIASPNVKERMDTIVKKISLDTTVIEQKLFKKTTTAKNQDQKAKEAAENIFKLEESMQNLITGYQEVNYEKGTMEFMYNQMKATRQDYLELFKGLTGLSTEVYTFYFIPVQDENATTLCKFLPTKGILPKTSATGDALQVTAKPVEIPAGLKETAASLSKSGSTPHGIYYRIPAMANLQIILGGQVKMEFPLLISQFGEVAPLPASGLKNVRLDTNTGALRELTMP